MQHLIKLRRSLPHQNNLTDTMTAVQWGDSGTGFGKAYREVICPSLKQATSHCQQTCDHMMSAAALLMEPLPMQDDLEAAYKAAREGGVTFFDTAEVSASADQQAGLR